VNMSQMTVMSIRTAFERLSGSNVFGLMPDPIIVAAVCWLS
jgi:hypothetical protein